MKWIEPQPVEAPSELQVAVGGGELLAQALVRRGLNTPRAALAFLDPEQYEPAPPTDLPDLATAVERLHQAISRQEGILVWGDFDVDGLTGTALLVEALRHLGGRVLWYIPDRLRESHGVHWSSLQPFLGRGVRVMVTVDTGIGAHHELDLARNAGLDVIVSDHHDLSSTLPSALAVVNPHRLPLGHPLASLSGAGVAYKLAEALGVPEKGLDLVALGLVADVVPQQGDVRYLLQRGLAALRKGARLGLGALMEVAEIQAAEVDEGQIGFALAPRLNALGRLAEASAAVELFLTDDLVRARSVAAEMEALNVRRQFLSRQVTAAAEDQVRRDPAQASAPVLVLAHADWPGGVLGIAASRLAERYNRPAVLIATPPGESARGSARSVLGIDIHAALAENAQLLTAFGGHPMAAGFALPAERIRELRSALQESVAKMTGEAPVERELVIETYLRLPQLSLSVADELGRLAPFGPGNPSVCLATRGLHIAGSKTIGRTGEHRRIEVQDEDGATMQTLWWQSASLPLPEGAFDLAYVLRSKEFRGERTLQLEWVDARWAEPVAVELPPAVVVADVADYRTLENPLPSVRTLCAEGNVQVWAEGAAVEGLTTAGRLALREGVLLVVWSTPPGSREWEAVLNGVRPKQVYLFAVATELDGAQGFIRRLAGLVKHALVAYGGRLEWAALAEAMGHRTETIRAGLRWLIAHGQVTLVSQEATGALVQAGGTCSEAAERVARRELDELLRETAAYRRYFRDAEAKRLVKG